MVFIVCDNVIGESDDGSSIETTTVIHGEKIESFEIVNMDEKYILVSMQNGQTLRLCIIKNETEGQYIIERLIKRLHNSDVIPIDKFKPVK